MATRLSSANRATKKKDLGNGERARENLGGYTARTRIIKIQGKKRFQTHQPITSGALKKMN